MDRKLAKRNEKIKKLQREIMMYDIEKKYLKVPEMAVYKKYSNGMNGLVCMKSEEVIKYILMPIGDFIDTIPYNNRFVNEDDEVDLNKQFHEYRNKINKTYREKAEQELNKIISEDSRKWAIVAALGTIVSIIISLLIAILK